MSIEKSDIIKEIKKIKDIQELENISKVVASTINKLDGKKGLWYIGQKITLKDTKENRKNKLYGKTGKIFTINIKRLMVEFEDGLIYNCPKQRMTPKNKIQALNFYSIILRWQRKKDILF